MPATQKSLTHPYPGNSLHEQNFYEEAVQGAVPTEVKNGNLGYDDLPLPRASFESPGMPFKLTR